MRDEHRVPCERKEQGQRLFQLGRTLDHFVGDRGQARDLPGNVALGVNKGIELLDDLSAPHAHGADLRNGTGAHVETGRLDIEHDHLVVEIRRRRAVHGACLIVDVIRLHAPENFEPVGFLLLALQHDFRECLHVPVVGDGNRAPAPADGSRDQFRRLDIGVHHGHSGVQVEFRPLFGGIVLPE